MNENPTCQGCCTNASWNWPYHYPQDLQITKIQNENSIGLTEDEKLCLNHLAEAWRVFNSLESVREDYKQEFRSHLHDLQRMIALRVAKRANPEIWSET